MDHLLESRSCPKNVLRSIVVPLIKYASQVKIKESFLNIYGTLQIKSFFRMLLPIAKNIGKVGYTRLKNVKVDFNV